MLHVDFSLYSYSERCTCGYCSIMDTNRKCICCKEVFSIVDKLDELDESGHVHVG